MTFATTSFVTTTGAVTDFDFFLVSISSSEESELDDESESLSLSGKDVFVASASSLATCFAESDSPSDSELDEPLLSEELSEAESLCVVLTLFLDRDPLLLSLLLLPLLEELELEPELESESEPELELELEEDELEELLDRLLIFLFRDRFAGLVTLTLSCGWTSLSESLELESSEEESSEELLPLSDEDASSISMSEASFFIAAFSGTLVLVSLALSLPLPLPELDVDEVFADDAWLLYT